MMTPVKVEIPFRRETLGALLYSLPEPKKLETIVYTVYVRKDKLIEAGHVGPPWPASITLTVDVGEGLTPDVGE